jgi:hypothetical protein
MVGVGVNVGVDVGLGVIVAEGLGVSVTGRGVPVGVGVDPTPAWTNRVTRAVATTATSTMIATCQTANCGLPPDEAGEDESIRVLYDAQQICEGVCLTQITN